MQKSKKDELKSVAIMKITLTLVALLTIITTSNMRLTA